MALSWQERFRAIFTGLVLADLRGAVSTAKAVREDAVDSACLQTGQTLEISQSALTWRQVLIQVAQFYGQESLPDSDQWSAQLRTIEAENPLGVCFAALPLMLLNLDGPGPGATALTRWAERQGLQVETQNQLKTFFHLLRQGMETMRPASASVLPPKTLDWLISDPLNDPLLTLAAKITLQAQGQYALALQLADFASAQLPGLLPLVGLLSTLQEGLPGIPLRWRLQYLNSAATQPARMQRWTIANEAALWQLADNLFYRWVGVSSSLEPSPAGLTYPVVQVGTALHWASGMGSL